MIDRKNDTELNASELIGQRVQFQALLDQDAGSIPEWVKGIILGVSVRLVADTKPRLKIYYKPSTAFGTRKVYIFDIDLADPFRIFGQVLPEKGQ